MATSRGIENRIRAIPQDLLNRGFRIAGAGRDVWLAGLGAVATVEESGGNYFNDLVDRGQKLEAEGRRKASDFKLSSLPGGLRSLPQEVFSRGTEMVGRSRDIWLAGLGALAAAQEEGGGMFASLVDRGQKLEARGKQQVDAVRDELTTRQKGLERDVSDRFETVSEPLLNALRRFGVPTRAEVRDLAASVDALSKKVDSLLTRLEREAGSGAEAATPGAARVRQPAAKQAVFMVVARDDEGWALRKEGRQTDISVHATKDAALEAARGYASERAPSRLEIYRKDGGLQDTIAYAT